MANNTIVAVQLDQADFLAKEKDTDWICQLNK